MNSYQFLSVIVAVVIIGPTINYLLESWRLRPDKVCWNGDFSLILGDDTLIPIRDIDDVKRESVTLPEEAILKGIILHNVPLGTMPCVKFCAHDEHAYEMDLWEASKGEIKMLLKSPWDHISFPKEILFLTRNVISNKALFVVTKTIGYDDEQHPGVWCKSLKLSFRKR